MEHSCSDPTSNFGSLVREYRRAAGLTQRELAARAGLSVAALRDFEQSRRHRPRAQSLAALAEALDLDPVRAASLDEAAAQPRGRLVPSPRLRGEDWSASASAYPAGPDEGLWLTMLGPLEAWARGAPLPLGPPARRAVLGLLLVDPGVLVRRDAIVDALWGNDPPRTAAGLVQSHVSRLRRLLGPPGRFAGNDEILSSARGGYRLLHITRPGDVS